MANNELMPSPNVSSQTRPAATRSSLGLIGGFLLRWGLLIFLCALFLIFSILEPRFATWTNVQNVIRQAAPLALLACGQSVVLIAGGVDVSVSAIIALSSVSMVAGVWTVGVIPGIVAAVFVGGLVGAINGSIIAFWGVNAFVVTLAMMTIVRGFSLYITGGIPMYGNIPESMLFLGNGDIGPFPTAIFVSAIGFAVLYYFLKLTPAGRQVYAVGGNKEAARLAGIKVGKITILAYVISGLFAGAAGAVLTSRSGIGAPNMGEGRELDAIAAAVIGGVAFGGGVGRVFGIILGVLILSVIKNGLNLYNVSSFVQLMVIGTIIIAAIVVDRYRQRREVT
ncbi:ABC transporter permease [Ancylobacter sp. G4_0304]|uniref:ABC transporter permease n=1 Tax=Ancylobacter sp. G4_0304 TaxID=3114289 RepID=UPI0039C60FD3